MMAQDDFSPLSDAGALCRFTPRGLSHCTIAFGEMLKRRGDSRPKAQRSCHWDHRSEDPDVAPFCKDCQAAHAEMRAAVKRAALPGLQSAWRAADRWRN